MMAKYIVSTKRDFRNGCYDDISSADRFGTPSVIESGPVDTGLVTVDGCPIMRVGYPIGFGNDDEWQ